MHDRAMSSYGVKQALVVIRHHLTTEMYVDLCVMFPHAHAMRRGLVRKGALMQIGSTVQERA